LIVPAIYYIEVAPRVVGHKFMQLGIRVEAERLESQRACALLRGSEQEPAQP
jgi:hypothetical protein